MTDMLAREDYFKDKIKDILLKRGEEPTEEKVEQILHDLEGL